MWEIKLVKLPNYLWRWRTPKTEGSFKGLKHLVLWFPSYFQLADWLKPVRVNQLIGNNSETRALNVSNDPSVFGVLYLHKYFGYFTYFISHAKSIYLKNINHDHGNTDQGIVSYWPPNTAKSKKLVKASADKEPRGCKGSWQSKGSLQVLHTSLLGEFLCH